MRVFTVNLDGKFREMVAAKTKKRALELLGCTAYMFANYGGENEGARDDEMQMAIDNPETVFKRRMAVPGAQCVPAGTPEPPPDPLYSMSHEELIDEVRRLHDGLRDIAARAEDWSGIDVRCAVADMLGVRVDELEDVE